MGESDFQLRSRQHDRNSGRAPRIPEEGSSCVDDIADPAIPPPRVDRDPARHSVPGWEQQIASAVQAFESYKLLMGITVTTLKGN